MSRHRDHFVHLMLKSFVATALSSGLFAGMRAAADEGFNRLFEPSSHPIAKEFDQDGDKKLDAEERAALTKALLVLYDANKNGVLDPVEGKAAEHWEDARVIETQCQFYFDRNRDHKLSRDEMQSMLARLTPLYDKNQNGLLDPDEARGLFDPEKAWLLFNVAHYGDHLDADLDDWMSPGERLAAAKRFPEYDLDKDGTLSLAELKAADQIDRCNDWLIQSGDTVTAGTRLKWPPEKGDQKRRLAELHAFYDVDGDGRCSMEEVKLARGMINLFSITTKTPHSADTNGNGRLDKEEKSALIADYLTAYDGNHDGCLSIQEMQMGLDVEREINRLIAYLRDREFDRNGDKFLDPEDRKAFLAATVKDFDANHNGIADPEECLACIKFNTALLETGAYKKRLIDVDHRFDAAAKAVLLNEMVKDYDLNQNGKMELDELRELSVRNYFLTCALALYPDIEPEPNDVPDDEKINALEKRLLKDYDTNKNGRIESTEAERFYRRHEAAINNARYKKENPQALQEKARVAKEAQEAKWRQRYDFNGNGQLDPEERDRAEKDAKAGILSPAME